MCCSQESVCACIGRINLCVYRMYRSVCVHKDVRVLAQAEYKLYVNIMYWSA